MIDIERQLSDITAELTSKIQGGQLCVYFQDGMVIDWCFGNTGKPYDRAIDTNTLFDVASLTKLLVTAAFVKLIADNNIDLYSAIDDIFPEFSKREHIPTWWHLLTHTSGLSGKIDNVFENRFACATMEQIAEQPPLFPLGFNYQYCNIGLYLVGKAIERIAKISLNNYIDNNVFKPFNMTHSMFLPNSSAVCASTEWAEDIGGYCSGIVHDENARLSGGVSGHAGIFSTAEDMSYFGEIFRKICFDEITHDSLCLYKNIVDMYKQSILTHYHNDTYKQGLCWFINASGEEPYEILSDNAFGHTGFTGTRLWIDPDNEITVCLLTNDVYRGRENRVLSNLFPELLKGIVSVL